jgi:hypothetical protein
MQFWEHHWGLRDGCPQSEVGQQSVIGWCNIADAVIHVGLDERIAL